MSTPCVGFLILLMVSEIRPEACIPWTSVGSGSAHISYVAHPNLTWAFAQSFCKRNGGNLLSMNVSKTGSSKWKESINLQSVVDSDKITQLVLWDGHRESGEADSCLKGIWTNDTMDFETDDCNSTHAFVCEAKLPCSSLPVLEINKVGHEGNGSLDIPVKDQAMIRCYTSGHRDNVTAVVLKCQGVPDKSNVLEMTITIDLSWHDRRCSCTATRKDGSEEKSEVTFNVLQSLKFAPGFRPPSYYDAFIFTDLFVKFKVVGNPAPNKFRLMKDGEDVSDNLFNYNAYAIVSALPNSTVVLNISILGYIQQGSYDFMMKNGIGYGLNWTFAIHIESGAIKSRSGPPYAVTVFLIFITFCALGSGVYLIAQRHTLEEEEDSQPDYYTSLNSMSNQRVSALEPRIDVEIEPYEEIALPPDEVTESISANRGALTDDETTFPTEELKGTQDFGEEYPDATVPEEDVVQDTVNDEDGAAEDAAKQRSRCVIS